MHQVLMKTSHNCSRCFAIFWYRWITTTSSTLSKTSFLMYVTVQLFIHSSPIRYRNLLLRIQIAENALYTVAVATSKISAEVRSKYTKGYTPFFFVSTIFFARPEITSTWEKYQWITYQKYILIVHPWESQVLQKSPWG